MAARRMNHDRRCLKPPSSPSLEIRTASEPEQPGSNPSQSADIDHDSSRFSSQDPDKTETLPIDTKCLPKFRLNKSSLQRHSQPWMIGDEPSLNQILEQERNAWLAQTHHDIVDTYDNAQGSYLLSLNPSHAPGRLDHIQVYNDDLPYALEPIDPQSRLARKSCFLEGSMNAGSRGVASTWNQIGAEQDRQLDSLPQDAECAHRESTPTPSTVSRTSMSSSLDINEFKPLPATPSTFKNTIKRFSQKLRSVDMPNESANLKPQPRSPVKPKNGLRKSVSTWKIFTPSTSDLENDASVVERARPRTKKRVKKYEEAQSQESRAHFDSIQRSILDERKRKAEIAYAEQFGTTRKRPRQDDPLDSLTTQCTDSADTGTVRKRRLSGSSTIRAARTVLRRVTSEQQIGPESITYSSDVEIPHLQTQRSTTDLSTSDDGRAKRQSRQELEKENQRLRSLLRDKEITELAPLASNPGPMKPIASQSANSDKKSSNATTSHNIRNNPPVPTCMETPTTRANGQNPSNAKVVQQNAARTSQQMPTVTSSGDIPPVPQLPAQFRNAKVLKSTSGNARYSQESATVKRRDSGTPLNCEARLPRPLSMVLEGLENELGQDESKQCGESDVSLTGRGKNRFDGAADGKNENRESSEVLGLAGNVQNQWQWPEDVF